VIVPGANGHCRYEFLLKDGEGAPGQPPPFALLQRLLAPHRQISSTQVERAVVYRFNAVVADRWQTGHVLLAGDAAHMMPPFAGQGLNSGIRDVNNVAWKIADVLDGRLSADQLKTYEQERRPHAEQIVKMSERLGHVVFTTSRPRARARDAAVHSAMRLRSVRNYLEEMRYRPTTTICEGLVLHGPDSPSVVGRVIDQPRVFDVTAHRKVLLDEVTGPRWALLGIETSSRDWERIGKGVLSALIDVRVDVGLDDHTPELAPDRRAITDLDGGLQRSFASSRGRFLLIRPDRVVAASFPPSGAEVSEQAIADWMPSGPVSPRRIGSGPSPLSAAANPA
jgi:3-(3-hydroxy-phenyl)propionate hydroxylase